MWLIRLDSFYYALLAFTISFAGYEGEIMRGAFLGVPRGELEAARAYRHVALEGTDTRMVPARRAPCASHACRRTGAATEVDTARLYRHGHGPDGRHHEDHARTPSASSSL